MDSNINNQLNIPKHIAIIPDGNRRWAKNKGLPTLFGHRQGGEAFKQIARKSRELGVHTLTVWGLSTENWNRSKEELDYLMDLYEETLTSNLKEAMDQEARIIHLGRKDRFRESLRNLIIKAEEDTKTFDKHVLNIALDYGGHDEINRAIESMAKDITSGNLTLEDIKKEQGHYKDKYHYYLLDKYLDTKNQPYPYPDLLIRTSGEKRLSGFLLWQMAYTEMYFTDLHMPDFGPNELVKAIEDFSNRNRRFGGN